ncbi:MAG: HAMP domain-containing histidine kinase [Chloroflexi bacterium]|nr:HAMP domain-containing histidine kinase [Chloroflexota bacterium]
MIRELMLFARRDKASDYRPVDVNQIINSATTICRQTFDRKIAIDVDIGNIPAILGDSMQLQQVFLNLCINARDALDLRLVRLEVYIPAEEQNYAKPILSTRNGGSYDDKR